MCRLRVSRSDVVTPNADQQALACTQCLNREELKRFIAPLRSVFLAPATIATRRRRIAELKKIVGGDVTEPSGSGLENLTLAFLGGTGDQGRGLARRFAMCGHRVLIGSRQAERAETAAHEVAESVDGPAHVAGMTNDAAAEGADVVVVAVPWEGHELLLRSLAPALTGKIVVDCVNPMGFDNRGAFAIDVPEGSAAEQAAALLPDSTVVAAFHHVSAVVLLDRDVDAIDTDILVLGDDRAATDLVQGLVDRIAGMRGVYGGRLRNTGQVEAFTANLVSINRRYKAHAGLRITDV
jgi:NADPH-dependent F420 reductase